MLKEIRIPKLLVLPPSLNEAQSSHKTRAVGTCPNMMTAHSFAAGEHDLKSATTLACKKIDPPANV